MGFSGLYPYPKGLSWFSFPSALLRRRRLCVGKHFLLPQVNQRRAEDALRAIKTPNLLNMVVSHLAILLMVVPNPSNSMANLKSEVF